METISSEGHLRMEGKPRSTTGCGTPIGFYQLDEDLAYILGFTFADGYVVRTSPTRYKLGWHLASHDEVLLQQIRNTLCTPETVTYRKDGSVSLETTQDVAWLSAMELGVIPNKTRKLVCPDIPDNLLPHFVRGYFDGDGSVYERKQSGKTWLCSQIVCGTKSFLQEIGDRIKEQIYLIPKILPHETIFRLTYNNMESAALYRWLYYDGCLCLDRKRKVFERWLMSHGGLNYGISICRICGKEYTKLSDRSPTCRGCKPLARKHYDKTSRTYNWKKIQSELISDGKINK